VSAETHVPQRPESPAVNGRAVVAAILGAFALMFGTIFAFKAIYDAAVPVKALRPPQTFPQPRVDTSDAALLHRLMAEQRRQLDTWRWADAEHTLVQIPIERAMRIVAQKGADGYAPLLPPQPALSSPQAGAQRVITPDAGPTPAVSAPATSAARPAGAGDADGSASPAGGAPASGAPAAGGTAGAAPSPSSTGAAGKTDSSAGTPPPGSAP